MAEARNISRWLTVAAVLQLALIFLSYNVLTRRLSAVASSLRDSLYEGHVAVEQVDKVNQAFSSISNDVYWGFLAGMVFTCVGSAVLRGIIKKSWSKPNPPTREGTEETNTNANTDAAENTGRKAEGL